MRQAGAAVVTIVALAGAGVVLFIVQWMLGWGGHAAVARSPEYLTWAAAVSVGVVIYWHVFARTRAHVRAPSRAALAVSVVARPRLQSRLRSTAHVRRPGRYLRPTVLSGILNRTDRLCQADRFPIT